MKYKLKLAVHSYDKGYTFEEPIGAGYWRDGSGRVLPAELCSLLNKAKDLPELLEPIPDEPTRWRAEERERFYFVRHNGLVDDSSPYPATAAWEAAQYSTGNYFRTQEQAQAVADAIKAMLEFVHGEGKDNGQWPAIVSEAREKVTE